MKPTSSTGLLIGAILAGVQVINGGAALGDVFGEKTAGLVALIIGAVQVGWHTYNQSVQVVPTSAVAAVTTSDGAIVAGPASTAANGTAVDVIATSDPTQAD